MNINENNQICSGLNQSINDRVKAFDKQLSGEIQGSNWYKQIQARIISEGLAKYFDKKVIG